MMKPTRRAELSEHRVPAAAVLRRVQRQQRRQAVPGAAERDALADAENRQQHDRQRPQARVARQEGDAGGGDAQQEQGEGQFVPRAHSGVGSP